MAFVKSGLIKINTATVLWKYFESTLKHVKDKIILGRTGKKLISTWKYLEILPSTKVLGTTW